MVARAVAATAIARLLAADSSRSRSANMARYQRSENPSHTVKREALTLKIASIASGRFRNKYAQAAYIGRARLPGEKGARRALTGVPLSFAASGPASREPPR